MSKIKHREDQVHTAILSGELEIDSAGRVWRVAARRWDRWTKTTRVIPCSRRRAENATANGYLQVRTMINGVRYHALAHRLVWRHANGVIPVGMTINHKNGMKSDNRLENLELATDSQQQIHANQVLGTGAGANQTGERNPFAKLTDHQVLEIRAARRRGEKLVTIAKRYGVTFQHISVVARGRSRSAG